MSDLGGGGKGGRGPTAGASSGRPASRELFDLHERATPGRGVALTLVALIIGLLLWPSATRAPLTTAATSTPATAPSQAPSTSPAPGPRRSTTTSQGPAPSTVHVLVANATTINGVAGAVTSFLSSKGFPTLAATNALSKTGTSQIYATPAGSMAAATEVASALGLPASAVQAAGAAPPVSNTTGASVVVIAGQDLATRFQTGSTTTTTTTASTTTTTARR